MKGIFVASIYFPSTNPPQKIPKNDFAVSKKDKNGRIFLK
jgi:hypothetical protein